MKKIAILLTLLFVISAACFIPFSQQKTIIIKGSFFNVYQQLANSQNWAKWRSDLRQVRLIDSTKISEKKMAKGFEISCTNLSISVSPTDGYSFKINEVNTGKTFQYQYSILPGKFQDQTQIILSQKTNPLKYLFRPNAFSRTHIADLKNFMEDVQLYYGYEITKRRITDTAIIAVRKVVLAKNKLAEATKSLTLLKQYASINGLTQIQPFIAQFLPLSKDSLNVNVGLPVNKKTSAKKPVAFMQMPAGNSYTVRFHGRFIDRQKAYAALQRYFSDRQLQMPALPFETYMDNKLPLTDTDRVNIRISFPSY